MHPTPSREAVERCLDAVDRLNPELRAVVTPLPEAARAESAHADAAAAAGRWLGLLHGMPVLVKDNIDTAGVRTTSGSPFFADRVPNRDAPVVARLRASGAVVLGKAALHELAFGIRSFSPVSGQVRNPWAPDRIPGGSSGGSAAAVATGMAAGALGTDTGGSVRLPAAMCGVSGLRPTVGRVPNRGSTPVSASQDTVGPMAREVADVARLFAAIAGFDPEDPWSEDVALENFLPGLGAGVAGVRIGLPARHYFDGAAPAIAEAVLAGARVLEAAGAELVDVVLPAAGEVHGWATVVIYADACEVHAERLAAEPGRFDPQVYERMRRGLDFTAVDYAQALRARERWKRELAGCFERVDVLLSPAVHTPVPPIEDGRSLHEATRDATRNTYAGAFGQIPGLSVPCGFAPDGLPIGMQLEARWWREPLLLRVGHAYQEATDWHRRGPPGAGAAAPG